MISHCYKLKESDFEYQNITTLAAIRNWFNLHNTNFESNDRLKCFDTMFREEQNVRRNSKTIENLGEYINSVGKLGCFILVNNFQGVNIHNITHPVVLRQPRPVLVSGLKDTFSTELFWVPHYIYPSNTSGIASGKNVIKRKCKLSKFLATFWEAHDSLYNLSDYCLRIIQHLFAFSAKPWNCEAQFGLFPPMKFHYTRCQEVCYPRTFMLEGPPERNTYNMLSLTVPTVNVIITHVLGSSGMASLQRMIAATHYQHFGGNDPYIYQSVFFHGLVSNVNLSKVTGESECSINYLKLVRLSYQNILRQQSVQVETPILIKYTSERFHSDSLSRTLSLTSASSPGDMVVWNVQGDLPCYGRFQRLVQRSSIEIVSEYRNRAWLSIFGNYTFQLDSETCCTNGVVETFSRADGALPLWSMYLSWNMLIEVFKSIPLMTQKYPDTFRSLRFISCSTIKHEPLLFIELISIYHASVWISLICIMTGLALLISRIARKESFLKSMIGMFKVVVGQGDPFMRHIFSSLPLRFAVVTVLFMAIIISEGYKNSNVYHIISPRRIVLKENLSELANDKFTVYTRTSFVEFYMYPTYLILNPETITFEIGKHDVVASQIVLVRSEVDFAEPHKALLELSSLHPLLSSIMRAVVLEHKDWFPGPQFEKLFLEEVKTGSNLMNPEEILPKIENDSLQTTDLSQSQVLKLKDIFDKWEEFFSTQEKIITNRSLEMGHIIRRREEEILFNFLENCNNAALILPEYLAVKYAIRLRIKDNQHFSIGKESFPPAPSGVFLHGFIPPEVIRRVKWSETSGIWEWHPAMAHPVHHIRSSHSKPVNATMQGHVIVIFLVMLTGLAFAGIGLLLEMCLHFLVRLPVVGFVRVARNLNQINISFAISTLLMDIANLVVRQTDSLTIAKYQR